MAGFEAIPIETERIVKSVLDSAFRVHSLLGPGLMESAYETCLCHELTKRSIQYRRQVIVPIRYDDIDVEAGFRADLIVEGRVIVELKAVEELHPIHSVQLMTYLKLTEIRVGLLINFNVKGLKDGIHRIVR